MSNLRNPLTSGVGAVNFPTCETCGHAAVIAHAAWDEHKRLRCFRVRTARDGTKMHPEGVGANPLFERDSLPEPQRVVDDKCGPDGRHWTPTKEIKAI